MSALNDLLDNEARRRHEFPICAEHVFLSHAAVTVLPRCVARAMNDYTEACCHDHQEFAGVMKTFEQTRKLAGELIGARGSEIALLGPTSLGLSLFANGLPWEEGDEIVCYQGDYPANVYPWMDLQRRGVRLVFLDPDQPGEITPGLVEEALTPKTRLVALASCHFLTGHRIDVSGIGEMLHARDILFSVDGIQTLGAFETLVEHVDFLSADAHKWLLGPMAIGIVYVAEEHHYLLRPSLLGAWNVRSPNFVTQDEIEFEPGARRYEPGVLNAVGIFGMKAALELIAEYGIPAISARLLAMRERLATGLRDQGFTVHEPADPTMRSGIVSAIREGREPLESVADRLQEQGIIATLRHDARQRPHLRFSPHFYNTDAEIERTLACVAG